MRCYWIQKIILDGLFAYKYIPMNKRIALINLIIVILVLVVGVVACVGGRVDNGKK
jgi:hypothetical protein